jgi:hypothetical protein
MIKLAQQNLGPGDAQAAKLGNRSTDMQRSFVVGNGVSRKSQPLEKLFAAGTVYACNYAVLEFPVHHGIVVDRTVLFDLLSQHNTNNFTVWSRKKWCRTLSHATPVYELAEELYTPTVRWDLEHHWGSGTHAVWKAASDGADVVVLLGFDLWNSGTNNNLYAGHKNYNTQPVDPRCWIYQLQQVFERHPNTMFVTIQQDNWQVPSEWQHLENFTVDNYANLWSWLDSDLVD